MVTTRSTTTRKRAATGDNLKPVINVSANAGSHDPIPITLVGKLYVITPPKSYLQVRMTRISAAVKDKTMSEEDGSNEMLSILDEWVEVAFGDHAEEVQKRFPDPKDSLDVDHIYDLMNQVTEYLSQNPTS